MKNTWLLFLLFFVGPLYAIRSSLVVFPLSSRGAGERFAWISYVIPEYFSRKLGTLEGIRVWDPQFLLSVDSSGWQLQSDSLLLHHQKRWQWDAAVGGSYAVDNDSVDITLEVVQISATSKPLRGLATAACIDAGVRTTLFFAHCCDCYCFAHKIITCGFSQNNCCNRCASRCLSYLLQWVWFRVAGALRASAYRIQQSGRTGSLLHTRAMQVGKDIPIVKEQHLGQKKMRRMHGE